jgi:hypothetical protein
MTDDELVTRFHEMWDGFPGLARLIDSHHTVIASNPIAQQRGFAEGAMCAKVGGPELHANCKLGAFFKNGEAVTDHVLDDRIRGWMPVEGRPDVCIHFAVMIPEE